MQKNREVKYSTIQWTVLFLTVWTVKQRVAWLQSFRICIRLGGTEAGCWYETFLAALRVVRWLWWELKLHLRTRTSNWKYNYPWLTVQSSSHLFLSHITVDFTFEWRNHVSQCGVFRTCDKNLSRLARVCLHTHYPWHRLCVSMAFGKA